MPIVEKKGKRKAKAQEKKEAAASYSTNR